MTDSISPSRATRAPTSTAAAIAARPERADKARNRARILAAASEAFAETGVETQMDAIAARAGVGVGTLYRHFATKEALMLAMVERKMSTILEVTRRGLTREGEPFEVLADVLREGAEVTSADAAAQAALMGAGDAVWEGASCVLGELEAETQVLIDRALRAGTIRPDASAADISLVMCGVSATMGSPQFDWRRHLEIVIDGLRAR